MTDRPGSWWGLRVRDDAGVVRRLDLRLWRRSLAARDPIARESMWYARRAMRAPWGLTVCVGFMFSAFGTAVAFSRGGIVRVLSPFMGADGVFLVGCFVVVCATVVCTMLLNRLIEGFAPSTRGAVPYMKTIRACAACAYALDGVTPSPDGMTTCPECGAMWKLDEVLNRRRMHSCDQCGYSLKGLPRDTAGVRTCPECGATWLLDEAHLT